MKRCANVAASIEGGEAMLGNVLPPPAGAAGR
jgi:hypothetical protein